MSRAIPSHLADILEDLELNRPELVTTDEIRELIEKKNRRPGSGQSSYSAIVREGLVAEDGRSRSLGIFPGRSSRIVLKRQSLSPS